MKPIHHKSAEYEWNKHCGFTLIEMLVVIAIISILAALMMPSLKRALDTSRTLSCANNLKQVFIVAHMYVDDCDGFFPPAYPAGATSWERMWQVPLSKYTDTPVAKYEYSQFKNTIFDCLETPGWNYNACWRNYGMNYRAAPPGSSWSEQASTPIKISYIKRPSQIRYIADASNVILDTDTWHWDARHMGKEKGNLLFYDGHVKQLYTLEYKQVPTK